MAKQLGISQPLYSLIETGKNKPSEKVMSKLNEIKMGEFDYSLVDNSTGEYLESKSYEIHGIAEHMRTKIGKELKEVQDRLAHNYKGVFAKWYESMGLDKNTVFFWINVYEFSRNLEDTSQIENFNKAPKSLQLKTVQKSAPKELQQKVLDGEIKTYKLSVKFEGQIVTNTSHKLTGVNLSRV